MKFGVKAVKIARNSGPCVCGPDEPLWGTIYVLWVLEACIGTQKKFSGLHSALVGSRKDGHTVRTVKFIDPNFTVWTVCPSESTKHGERREENDCQAGCTGILEFRRTKDGVEGFRKTLYNDSRLGSGT